MFVWTQNSVLNAMDAGVPQVVELFNATYAKVGTRTGFAKGAAHRAALNLVVFALNTREQDRLARKVDALVDALVPVSAPVVRSAPVFSAVPEGFDPHGFDSRWA